MEARVALGRGVGALHCQRVGTMLVGRVLVVAGGRRGGPTDSVGAGGAQEERPRVAHEDDIDAAEPRVAPANEHVADDQ